MNRWSPTSPAFLTNRGIEAIREHSPTGRPRLLCLNSTIAREFRYRADTISPCRRFSNLRPRSVQTSKKCENYEDCSEPLVGKTLNNTVNVRRVLSSRSIHRSRSITHIQPSFQA